MQSLKHATIIPAAVLAASVSSMGAPSTNSTVSFGSTTSSAAAATSSANATWTLVSNMSSLPKKIETYPFDGDYVVVDPSDSIKGELKQQAHGSLFEAVEAGEVKKVKSALENGFVEINAQNKDGETILMLAAYRGDKDMVIFLLEEGADPFGPKLSFAKNQEMVDLLEAARALVREFFDAVRSGNTEMVQVLLSRGSVKINARDSFGDTALMEAVLWRNVDMVTCLLKVEGVKVDEKNSYGMTALMFAAMRGREEIVRLLLEAGASSLKTDNDGETALDMAIRAQANGGQSRHYPGTIALLEATSP
jgi:ankyrin repeat protein